MTQGACKPLHDLAVTDSLDVVAIGIEHERAVVIFVIMRSQPRRAIISSAGRKRGLIESIDDFPIRRRKGDMRAGLRNALEADPEERLPVGAVAGAVVLDMQPLDAERTECRIIKRLRAPDFADAKGDVVQHFCLRGRDKAEQPVDIKGKPRSIG